MSVCIPFHLSEIQVRSESLDAIVLTLLLTRILLR